jgi:hypothetical protein
MSVLQESDLAKSSRSHGDARVRLEQAKHRYENLLMQVGPTMIVDDLPQPGNIEAFSDTQHILSQSSQTPLDYSSNSTNWDHNNLHTSSSHSLRYHTPEESANGFDNAFVPKSPFRSAGKIFYIMHLSYFSFNNLSFFCYYILFVDLDKNNSLDKNETIILLQEENDRLRSQLEYLTNSTEQLLQEAEDTNNALIAKYEGDLDFLHRKNKLLHESNIQLEASYRSVQQELAQEKAHLQKTLTLLDRFQRRSRDYIEVQRKSHQVLKQLDGMHYTAHMQNEHLQHLQAAQRHSQQQYDEDDDQM